MWKAPCEVTFNKCPLRERKHPYFFRDDDRSDEGDERASRGQRRLVDFDLDEREEPKATPEPEYQHDCMSDLVVITVVVEQDGHGHRAATQEAGRREGSERWKGGECQGIGSYTAYSRPMSMKTFASSIDPIVFAGC